MDVHEGYFCDGCDGPIVGIRWSGLIGVEDEFGEAVLQEQDFCSICFQGKSNEDQLNYFPYQPTEERKRIWEQKKSMRKKGFKEPKSSKNKPECHWCRFPITGEWTQRQMHAKCEEEAFQRHRVFLNNRNET
jgi:hypothetical protein